LYPASPVARTPPPPPGWRGDTVPETRTPTGPGSDGTAPCIGTRPASDRRGACIGGVASSPRWHAYQSSIPPPPRRGRGLGGGGDARNGGHSSPPQCREQIHGAGDEPLTEPIVLARGPVRRAVGRDRRPGHPAMGGKSRPSYRRLHVPRLESRVLQPPLAQEAKNA